MTVVSIVMVAVLGARFSRGWPGPRTYTFIVATIVVIVIAIMAWRRVNAEPRTTGPNRS
jgi:sugar phosphate permease